MAIGVMNWVWDHSDSRHGARLVLLAIADCVKTDGGWAWPSNKELQRKTNLTERAVRTAVAELIELGELGVDLNSGPGGCNRYRVITTTTPPAESAPGKDCPPKIMPPGRFCSPWSLRSLTATPRQILPPLHFLPPGRFCPTPRQDLPPEP